MSGRLDASPLAEIAIVRVLTAAEPYTAGDVLSVAFTSPGIARLRCHDGRSFDEPPPLRAVPEVVSAIVVYAAGPYREGQLLSLAFLEPSLAKIHVVDIPSATVPPSTLPPLSTLPPPSAPPTPVRHVTERDATQFDAHPPLADLKGRPEERKPIPFCVKLQWSGDRVRRFVQVCDKLFTVDRLGWYRHSLVLRLLVPDDIRSADLLFRTEATRQLEALRSAVGTTLGNPLLAAFMPNFSVTPSWLESLETAEIACALAALRGVLAPHLLQGSEESTLAFESVEETLGAFTQKELLATPFSSLEAGLALLLPHASPIPMLADSLGAYRAKLGELFGQMADTPEKARLKQMTQSNHVLDDQLWQLVSAVQQTFEPVPAA
jgi:hypothetical protein